MTDSISEGGYRVNSLFAALLSIYEAELIWEAIMKEKLGSENTNLLWTGGWDSTFQLLQLLTVHRQRITPFYMIHADRPSTGVELKTIKDIRSRLFEEYPYTQDLLQPGHYFAVADIAPCREITEAFQEIIKVKKMGSQYEWLARFCRQNAITEMQLCVHRDDKAHRVIERLVSKCDLDTYTTYWIEPKYAVEPEYALFGYFSFPIFDLSKLQMAAIAKEQGLENIMKMTWFCHHPLRDRQPCGRCKPCIYTMEEGLGWRMPLGSRIAYYQSKLAWRLKTRVMRSVTRLKLSDGA